LFFTNKANAKVALIPVLVLFSFIVLSLFISFHFKFKPSHLGSFDSSLLEGIYFLFLILENIQSF